LDPRGKVEAAAFFRYGYTQLPQTMRPIPAVFTGTDSCNRDVAVCVQIGGCVGYTMKLVSVSGKIP
jgi:hypothetical protein